jgi:hypothetical protein
MPMLLSPFRTFSSGRKFLNIINITNIEFAIYAPTIYTPPYVPFMMRADPLRGQVGGGWALEIETFWGPEMAMSEASAIWEQKNRDVQFICCCILPPALLKFEAFSAKLSYFSYIWRAYIATITFSLEPVGGWGEGSSMGLFTVFILSYRE